MGRVGQKLPTYYLLRVRHSFAFCCPLLSSKLSIVFLHIRILPGVLVFQTYRRFLRKRHICAGIVPECDFGCRSGGDFVTDQEASTMIRQRHVCSRKCRGERSARIKCTKFKANKITFSATCPACLEQISGRHHRAIPLPKYSP